jgi:hypothetical protein
MPGQSWTLTNHTVGTFAFLSTIPAHGVFEEANNISTCRSQSKQYYQSTLFPVQGQYAPKVFNEEFELSHTWCDNQVLGVSVLQPFSNRESTNKWWN